MVNLAVHETSKDAARTPPLPVATVAARDGRISVLAVLLGVVLARLAGMVDGVLRMAMRRVRVMRRLLVSTGFVMLRRLAMVLGGMLVMLGGGAMMLDDLFLGHGNLSVGRARSNDQASPTLTAGCCGP